MGQFVDLTSADGFVLPAWVARPEGAPRGAVVVLQEIFGVNSHIRAVADRLAARGYLAVAPATFARVKAGVELGYEAQDMQDGMALSFAARARGDARIELHAQCSAQAFYARAGFAVCSAPFEEAGIAHVEMVRRR